MKNKIILSLLFLASLSACKTDFDVNAPYKETPVVFGLINPDTSTQFIRINKAFLGEGNANTMAKVMDSVNYAQGELDVSIQRFKSTVAIKEPIVLSDTVVNTEGGAFSTKQRLYVTHQRFYYTNNRDTSYVLTVKNKRTGKVVTAQTFLTGRISVKTPVNFISLVGPDNAYLNPSITWITPYNTKQYQIVLRFFFTEQKKSDPSNQTLRYIDFNAGLYQAETGEGGLSLTGSVSAEAFFRNIAAHLTPDPSVNRKIGAGKIQIRFTAITPDFYNYVEINKPSIGIVQEKPEFTNIKGGIGFFSCRSIYPVDVAMDQYARQKLVSGDETRDLGFTNP